MPSDPLQATLSVAQAAAVPWNVVVVGAGPAGAMAALLLSRRGRRVLLVDKSPFPREKVCGCCLNSIAASVLRHSGVGGILDRAMPLRRLSIRNGHTQLELDLPDSYSISRDELDSEIVRQAILAGAQFIPSCAARLPATREEGATTALGLAHGGSVAEVHAELVLAGDGLRGHLMDAIPGSNWQIAKDAWIGVAATLEGRHPFIPAGMIAMHLSRSGYVGAVLLQNGKPHLAAALPPAAARRAGGPARLIRAILRTCGVRDCPPLQEAGLTGTPLLTRRRLSLGGYRVLACGDACGYVEPFTGEGIAWALQSAQAMAETLPPSLEHWPADLPKQWTRRHASLIGKHHRACRGLRYMLHHPGLTAVAIQVASDVPAIAQRLVQFVNHPPRRPAVS